MKFADKHGSCEVFWGYVLPTLPQHRPPVGFATDRQDWFSKSKHQPNERLAAGYEWTKSSVVPNWQSITVNDGGKENSSALVCSYFSFFMGQEKTRKHVYSWNSQEHLAYICSLLGFIWKCIHQTQDSEVEWQERGIRSKCPNFICSNFMLQLPSGIVLGSSDPKTTRSLFPIPQNAQTSNCAGKEKHVCLLIKPLWRCEGRWGRGASLSGLPDNLLNF